MNIALIGYGKMGKLVEQIALSRQHKIGLIIDSAHSIRTISQKQLNNIDICIDFSHPDHALENLRKISSFGVNLVMGTTGCYERLSEAKQIVADSKIGFLYAPNFCLGIAIFSKVLEYAGSLISAYDSYDVEGLEIHHRKKVDAPSGTAIALAENLNRFFPQKKEGVNFSSIRVGETPGTHSIIFDSAQDTITLSHTARNRDGFGLGAVCAAEWLNNKRGFYTLEEMLNDKK